MASDLDELRQGVAYCREKTAAFREEFLTFGQSNIRVRIDNWPHQPGSGQAFGTLLKDVPDAWKRDVGGIMNELRAQLDYLANVLARRNGANDDGAHWPMVAEESKWNADARKPVRRLSDEDKAKVALLQPFNDSSLECLPLLHHGDIVRKHRRPLKVIATVGANPAGSGTIGYMQSGYVVLEEVRKEYTLANWMATTCPIGANAQLAIHATPEIDVFAIDFLEQSADAVERVINEFD